MRAVTVHTMFVSAANQSLVIRSYLTPIRPDAATSEQIRSGLEALSLGTATAYVAPVTARAEVASSSDTGLFNAYRRALPPTDSAALDQILKQEPAQNTLAGANSALLRGVTGGSTVFLLGRRLRRTQSAPAGRIAKPVPVETQRQAQVSEKFKEAQAPVAQERHTQRNLQAA